MDQESLMVLAVLENLYHLEVLEHLVVRDILGILQDLVVQAGIQVDQCHREDQKALMVLEIQVVLVVRQVLVVHCFQIDRIDHLVLLDRPVLATLMVQCHPVGRGIQCFQENREVLVDLKALEILKVLKILMVLTDQLVLAVHLDLMVQADHLAQKIQYHLYHLLVLEVLAFRVIRKDQKDLVGCLAGLVGQLGLEARMVLHCPEVRDIRYSRMGLVVQWDLLVQGILKALLDHFDQVAQFDQYFQLDPEGLLLRFHLCFQLLQCYHYYQVVLECLLDH